MTRFRTAFLAAFVAALVAASIVIPASTARAELLVSQLVVELTPGLQQRADVEVLNSGPDRLFVAVDPREIVNPGASPEASRSDPDPDVLGILVSPTRMILESGQRKVLRVAAITPGDRERVYRITVKPVVGQLSSEGSGLKVLVGYDMLVLVRPIDPMPHVSGQRIGDQLRLKNDGNVSVELVDGQACDTVAKTCQDLPAGRLYVGGEKVVGVGAGKKVSYKLKIGSRAINTQF